MNVFITCLETDRDRVVTMLDLCWICCCPSMGRSIQESSWHALAFSLRRWICSRMGHCTSLHLPRIFVDAYYVIRLTCTQPAEKWNGQCLGARNTWRVNPFIWIYYNGDLMGYNGIWWDYVWLVVWNKFYVFIYSEWHHPNSLNTFQRGRYTTNQNSCESIESKMYNRGW